MEQIELTLGRWSFDRARPLGPAGGFGAVYEGLAQNGALVAVKVLHSIDPADSLREIEFAKGFVGRDAEHVIRIYDSGIDASLNRACMVMERAEGSLAERLRSGVFELNEACSTLEQIVSGCSRLETGSIASLRSGGPIGIEAR